MATNQYFKSNYTGHGEQDLLNNLTRECIQAVGYDMYYMPRENISQDYLFGEDVQSAFKDAIAIECYIKTVTGYSGAGDILSKFGLDIQDDMMIQMNIQRFNEEITMRFPDRIRPREGDLVYFSLDTHSVFEISFVENKKPFYQLGQVYIYELSLKRFVFGGENINTGVAVIDDIITRGDSVDITLGAIISTSNEYIVGEIAYQSLNTINNATASGEVMSHIGNVLTLRRVKGEFNQGINITGQTSGTICTFPIKSDLTFDDSENNKIANNIEIRTEVNSVLDFSESNPFLDTSYN